MKAILIILVLFISSVNYGQIPAYYNDVDLTTTGLDLKNELSQKTVSAHNITLTYSQVWNVLKSSDISPSNSNNVMLIYGWDDSDSDITNDLTRDKADNGGNTGDWNREHTFAKSLGTPNLGTSGPGADVHNLRASDVQRNGSRGNKKFATGTGVSSGTVGPNWYPGNEWRGDVARIIMYMYLRYNQQCKPSSVCVGNPVTIDLNMVDILLEWNALDPVSSFEENRNVVIQQNQGNRNPFIDNPYLATLIWGGTAAENKWNLSVIKVSNFKYSIYPNPSFNHSIYLTTSIANQAQIKSIAIYDICGKVISIPSTNFFLANKLKINNLPKGINFIQIVTYEGIITRKIIVN